MPKVQLVLSAEEREQLGTDLDLIAMAARKPHEGVSKTMIAQLDAYEYFLRGAYDVGPGEAEWPAPMDHTTCHQSSCDRCAKVDSTVRLRHIEPPQRDPSGRLVSVSFFNGYDAWRCDGCDVTPYVLGYDRQGQREVTDG